MMKIYNFTTSVLVLMAMRSPDQEQNHFFQHKKALFRSGRSDLQYYYILVFLDIVCWSFVRPDAKSCQEQ
jgi:hypothetical protein